MLPGAEEVGVRVSLGVLSCYGKYTALGLEFDAVFQRTGLEKNILRKTGKNQLEFISKRSCNRLLSFLSLCSPV